MWDRVVRVRDIDPEVFEMPFCLDLARGVCGPYLDNGSRYFGFHLAPNDLREFFLTAIIDENTPDTRDTNGKLMVQGGVQYGCSARSCCPFCVYQSLKYYRNLYPGEIVDLFRLSLSVYCRHYNFRGDSRILTLKFSDDGEPLENPNIIEALDSLAGLFGIEGKILCIKVSTVLRDTEITRAMFDRLVYWQENNLHRASVHLQVSRPPYGKKIIPAYEVIDMIRAWKKANPYDKVCVAPGLVKGFDENEFYGFCRLLKVVARHCFIRLSVIKPTTKRQKKKALDREILKSINSELDEIGLEVDPLPQNSTYTRQLEGAGTCSHMPDGKLYDPLTYKLWEYSKFGRDNNGPSVIS